MLYRVPAAASPARILRHGKSVCSVLILAAQFVCGPQPVRAQNFAREVDAPGKLELRVKNRTGRVIVVADDAQKNLSINATSAAGLPVGERDVRVESGAGGVSIEVEREGEARAPAGGRKVTLSPAQVERERIDVTVRVPTRTRVFVETEAPTFRSTRCATAFAGRSAARASSARSNCPK
jgi:hypothetical protein